MYEIRPEKHSGKERQVIKSPIDTHTFTFWVNLLLKRGWQRGEDELTRTMKVRDNPVPGLPAAGSTQESLLAVPLWCKSGNQRK